MSGVEVIVGSMWRRNSPGREVVRVERVWMYSAMGDPAELTVRAHPITGGRPLVAPVEWLGEHYSPASPPPGRPVERTRGHEEDERE